jgi:hypothetical protein
MMSWPAKSPGLFQLFPFSVTGEGCSLFSLMSPFKQTRKEGEKKSKETTQGHPMQIYVEYLIVFNVGDSLCSLQKGWYREIKLANE